MAFCVFRGFCVKLHTQDFSHTAQNFTEIYSAWHSVYSVDSVWNTTQKIFRTQDSTELHRIYPHGILCVPWILCETPHRRFFARTEISQNLLRMVFCVFRSVQHRYWPRSGQLFRGHFWMLPISVWSGLMRRHSSFPIRQSSWNSGARGAKRTRPWQCVWRPWQW